MNNSSIILLVDDSIGVQRAVHAALAPQGHLQVVCCGDAEEAESWLASHVPSVVLCDVVLPGRTGYELCRRVRQETRTARCPVLLLSSPFEPFDDEEAQDCGAVGVVQKPFTAADLRARVASLLDSMPAKATVCAPGGAQARIVDVPPSEDLEEVEEGDLIDAATARHGELVSGLVEPLATLLEEPVSRRLLKQWQEGPLPETVARRVSEAAERLIRRRIQELEDEAADEPLSEDGG